MSSAAIYIGILYLFVIDKSNAYDDVIIIQQSVKCKNISFEQCISNVQDKCRIGEKWITFFELELTYPTERISKFFENVLVGNSFLTKVKISNSSLKFIDNSSFVDHTGLKSLDLSWNHLSDALFVENLPYGLEYLNLSHNSFESIPKVFGKLKNLRVLDLSFCSIKNINFVYYFTIRGSEVRVIDFSHNQISKLTDIYVSEENNRWAYSTSSRSPIRLDFSYNEIRQVKLSTMLSYSNMPYITLNLASNKLTKIEDISLGVSGLDVLDLSDNNFKYIGVPSKPSSFLIQSINLSKSNISNVNLDMLKEHFPQLNSLDLSQNTVLLSRQNTLPLSFSSISFFNSSIHRINKYYFSNVTVKNVLNISYNNIPILENFSFNMARVGKLDLSFSNLEKIERNAFHNARIIVLLLNNNRITYLDESTFLALETVREINLSFNPLKKLNNDLFFSCALLKVLNFSHSQLEVIRDETFSNTFNLDMLDLSNNMLTQLNISMSAAISSINIENNSITQIDRLNFANVYVKRIVFRGNKIKILTNGAFNNTGKNISEIDLSNASVYFISQRAFKGLLNLRILNLSNNYIEEINADVFGDVKNLLNLDLSGNNIATFSPEAFNDRNSLNHLSLSFTGNLPEKTFITLNALRRLTFINSTITSLQTNCFSGLVGLNRLEFVNPTINAVAPGAFHHLFNLDDVNLAQVFLKTQTLRKHNLAGLLKMTKIDLSSLNISSIEEKTFEGLRNVSYLHLGNNHLTILNDYTFVGLKYLLNLNLSFNDIGHIETNTFVDLCALKNLTLSHNNLQQFDLGVFLPLDQLQNLMLDHNSLNKLVTGTFSNLNSLQYLDLSYNNLSSIIVETFFPLQRLNQLDLTHNHLIEINYDLLLKSLTDLQFVGLNKNKWRCSNLMLMLIDFKQHSINWRTSKEEVFHSENIDGVECVDICKFLYCDENQDSI